MQSPRPNAARIDRLPGEYGTQSETVFPEQWLPIIQPFMNDFANASARYRRVDGGGLIPHLLPENQIALANWLMSQKSELLPITDMSTELTLEMADVIDYSIMQPRQAGHTLSIVHLCRENEHLKAAQPGIMVLDLIHQVFKHQRKFGQKLCSQEDLMAVQANATSTIYGLPSPGVFLAYGLPLSFLIMSMLCSLLAIKLVLSPRKLSNSLSITSTGWSLSLILSSRSW